MTKKSSLIILLFLHYYRWTTFISCARRLILNEKYHHLIPQIIDITSSLNINKYPSKKPTFMGPVVLPNIKEKMLNSSFNNSTTILAAKNLGPGGLLSPRIEQCNSKFKFDDELFGPILFIQLSKTLDHAIEIANQSSYGLSSSLYSKSKKDYIFAQRNINSGIINWNNPTTGASGLAPFGGVKNSGNYRPGGFNMIDHCVIPVGTSQSKKRSSIGDSWAIIMAYQQVFIDCMPGPTYHFGGHSYGNIASMNSANKPSNPKKAALEWINKIKMIKSIGSKQIILPPHRRPLYGYKKSPNLHHLSSAYTWMANSGHFTASCDTKDNSPIFTPSNMNQTNHRLKEHYFNRYWINKIFKNKIKCTKPFHSDDEGAANTIRLSNQSLSLGLNIYVYGNKESHYPCRQSKKSIESLIKTHRIHNYFTLKQSKRAIDAGIFHNDVISFGFKKTFYFATKKLSKIKSLNLIFSKINTKIFFIVH